MQSCGGCSVQQVSEVAQVLMNPVTWLIAITAITSLLPKKRGSK